MPKLRRGIQYVPKNANIDVDVTLADLGGTTAHQVLYTDGVGTVTGLTHGTSTHVLTSNGPAVAPSWQAVPSPSLALDGLSDVNTGTPGAPEDGYALVWVDASSEYQLAAVSGGSSLTYVQDDTDHIEGLYTTHVAFETDSLGIVVNGVNTDVQPRINFLDGDGGTQVGNIRATSTGFVVDNRRTSGHVLLRASDATASVVPLFDGDPDGDVILYYDNNPTLYVQTGGIRVRGQSTSADVEFADSAGTQMGRLVATSSSFSFGANGHGATVSITGENSGGTPTFLFLGDPDGDFELYNAGSKTLESDTLGVNILDTGGDNPLLKMLGSAGQDAGWLYFGATGGYIRNFQNGQNFRYLGNDAGGTSTTMLEIDPDGAVDLYYDGGLAFSTTSLGVDVFSQSGAGNAGQLKVYAGGGTEYMDLLLDGGSNLGVLTNRVPGGDLGIRVRNAGDTANEYGVLIEEGGATSTYYDGSVASQTTSSGLDVRHPTSTTPDLGLRNSSNALLGQLGVVGTTVRIRNRTNGADVNLTANDTGGTERTLFNGDPDDSVILYYAGTQALSTTSIGVDVRSTTTDPYIRMYNTSGTRVGDLAIASGTMAVDNRTNSGHVLLRGRTAAAATYVGITVDPDVGVGFNNAAAVAAPTYTVTNDLTDRTFDANTVAIAELADVVGTIIADLQANGLFA